MNNRVKALAEQARKYARDYVADCKHYGYYMDHDEFEQRFENKFAELLIDECAKQCDQVSGLKYSPNTGSAMAGCKERILLLKE